MEWQVETAGLKVAARTGADEISAVHGTVTFHPGEVRGERCGNEFPIPVDTLGSRAETIIGRIRSKVPSGKVMISPHLLNIYCAGQEEVCAALTTIGELSPARLRLELFEPPMWRSDRIVHYEISPYTPLTTVSGTLGFDDKGNNVPFRILHDVPGRSLREGDLTKLGEQFLAGVVESAQRLRVSFVTIGRNCFDFCLLAPCEEEKKPEVASLITNSFSFALA